MMTKNKNLQQELSEKNLKHLCFIFKRDPKQQVINVKMFKMFKKMLNGKKGSIEVFFFVFMYKNETRKEFKNLFETCE